jgi:tetratricopeptide (TPR) repeat protein
MLPHIIPPPSRLRQAAARGAVLLVLLAAGCARTGQAPDAGTQSAEPAIALRPLPTASAAADVAALARAVDAAATPLALITPAESPTPIPSATPPPPTPTPAPSASPTTEAQAADAAPVVALSGPVPPTAAPGAGAHTLPGVAHVYQKWNNCGPSTILMALSAFGVQLDQLAVAAQLKPDREDTNVTPEELAAFARSQGLAARVRFNGNRDIVRALVHVGVPVVVEQWIDVHGRGAMGHFRVVTGYDNGTGEFIVNDSYYGPNRRHSYDTFDREWAPFLGAYVAVYRPEQEGAVRAAIGGDWDDAAMWQRALADQTRRAAEAPNDPWSWYALGEVQSHLGDYPAAVESFDRANGIGLPFRAYWYQFGYYRALYEIGALDRLIAHADATIESMKGENLEESHYWRGLALRQLGREDEARASFARALEFNPLYAPAREALGG